MTAAVDTPRQEAPVRRSAARTRELRFAVFTGLLAVLTAAGMLPNASGVANFRLDAGRTAAALPDVAVPVNLTLGLIAVALVAVTVALAMGRLTERAILAVAVTSGVFVLGYLVYAVAGQTVSFVGLLRGTITAATPIAFGALAGVLCERAGVINIAIEGQFLAAAFTGALVGSIAGSPWIGLVGGILAGVLVAAMLAGLSIKFRADQIVVGVVLIVLATGFTSFLDTQILAANSDLNRPPRFAAAPIPGLSEIPFVGPLLFRLTPLTYAMLLIVVYLQYALFNTRWGLRLRSVGEKPRASDTVGIPVNRTRWRAVLLGGVMAGLGGAWFTLDSVGQFSSEMTGGRGFIALAAMLVGRYTPKGAFGAALLFGFATALADTLSLLSTGVPSSLLRTAPYVVTLFVVAGLVGRLRPPAANGTPYETD